MHLWPALQQLQRLQRHDAACASEHNAKTDAHLHAARTLALRPGQGEASGEHKRQLLAPRALGVFGVLARGLAPGIAPVDICVPLYLDAQILYRTNDGLLLRLGFGLRVKLGAWRWGVWGLGTEFEGSGFERGGTSSFFFFSCASMSISSSKALRAALARCCRRQTHTQGGKQAATDRQTDRDPHK